MLTLTGCSAASPAAPATDLKTSASSGTQKSAAAKPTEEAAPAPDLIGEWKQTNSNSSDAYQKATITGDTITVDWMTDGGSTTSIYWIGTFTPPTDAETPFTWTSTRDTAATDSALLASSDPTKDFTFNDDVISYTVSIQGTTGTVELKRS
ncbi:hypothetical protein [Curtobacterium sp. RRHDQ10]|uniref:hypothetical protein n=1 Tax=Curtobacterium phyllosphaerae TaxID=3413379 RepID=UPI003BF15CE1